MTLRTPNQASARWTRYAVVAAALTTPTVAYTYELPGPAFEAGTPISAADVNAKLDALLDAANELEATTEDLDARIAPPRERISTHWPDRAIAWSGNNAVDEVSCTRWINGRPGCIVSGWPSAPSVVVPLDGVSDGTLLEWGMHIGTSNSTGTSTTWDCDLRFNGDVLSSLSFDVDAPSQWSRFVNVENLDVPVDMDLDGVALGAGFAAGWDVWCESSGPNGRFDLHQIYVRTREDAPS